MNFTKTNYQRSLAVKTILAPGCIVNTSPAFICVFPVILYGLPAFVQVDPTEITPLTFVCACNKLIDKIKLATKTEKNLFFEIIFIIKLLI